MLKTTLTMATAALALEVLGTITAANAADGSLERVRKAGVAIVCSANDVPYAYKDPNTGEPTGTDVDMVRSILQKIGVPKLELYTTEFSSLIPALQSGRCDFIADNMGITVKRSQQVAFTAPMYQAGLVIIVPKGNPAGLTDVSQFSGKTLAAYLGAIQLDWMKEMAKKDPTITVKAFKNATEIIAELGARRLDGALVDSMIAANVLKTNPSAPFEIVDHKLPIGDYAIGAAFRKEDQDLRHAFEDAHRDNLVFGGFDEVLTKWQLTPKSLYFPYPQCCAASK